MRAHEANYAACQGIRHAVAADIERSPSLVNHWCNEPALAGDRSPTERFLEFVLSVQKRGGAERAKILLDFILAEAGCLPAEPLPDEASEPVDVLTVSSITHEFSEYLAAAAQAFDGVNLTELAAIETELVDVITVAARQLRLVRSARAAEETRQLARRAGPRRATPRVINLQQVAG